MYDLTCSIVLFHNDPSEVKKAVDSVINSNLHVKLFIVDNSREDDLRFEFNSSKVEYIFTGRNLGYGAGHNVAIKRITGKSKYHLVLNPDVEFDPAILPGLFAYMEQYTQTGLLMPKVLYKNGEIQYLCKQLPSPADLILRRFMPTPMKQLFREKLASYELRHLDYNNSMQVPNLSGCFMFIRTEAFSKVGLFDEQYFMYLEDTDLCRRINEQYNTVYYPQETIIHGYAKSSYKNLKLATYHVQSTLKYFNKWGWYNDRMRSRINKSLNTANIFRMPVVEHDIITAN
ncbi:glycosyltransferase family 2 protein [Flavihumibacter sp. ZG627]|uniref:glycosyltransferase family 2 protein n=1 Tax=Flavihumibacter sp. ZG627 TaxID=1463156 RepID=UPI000693F605|nr:glycosyltransferase family 2 protein [Flavihumibacter sp. ZG627]